jgi:hypothetical protein
MSDDKTNPGPEDGKLISLKEPYEVEYWTAALNVDLAVLEQAVAAVGHSPAAVRAWLADHPQTC